MVLALAWLFLVLCNSSFLVCSLDDERVALLSLKQSVSDDPEGSLNNWNSSDDNLCSWNGITCREGKVVSISIPKKKLVGFLPSGLESLSSLQRLDLKNNKFYGSLPLGLFYVQGLRSLVLSGNTFSGSIPPSIGNLGYLQILDLSQNFLNGSLPTSLIQCKRLRSLDLSHNSFTGSLPLGFVSNALENLNISYNKLSGSIGDLSSLQGPVDLSHNLFSGSIPPSLGNLPEKFYIDLSYNNLSGPIPNSAVLLNRGATIFTGNPGLCGPPLKDPCSSNAAGVGAPTDNGFVKSGKIGLISKNAVIAIVVSDVVGILFIGWLFSYCYLKMCNGGKRSKGKKECLCFRKDLSETSFENIEQDGLIPLDKDVGFDLDELLKASAFVLGKSGIGIMYKVVLEDGVTFAVRRLGEGGFQRFKEFRLEVEAIGEIRHPNIVPLRAYYWSVDEKLLIYDYVPNGNLATAIVHGIQSFSEKAGMSSFIPLRWSVRLRIMKGIADGLACLHEFSPKKFVHGNLKTSNILLGHNLEPLIADFGLKRLADIVGSSPMLQSNQMTSPKLIQKQSASTETCYQTPEAMKMVRASQECDVYSYGLILLELISGRSSTIQISTSGMDLVQWIQLFIEEKKPFSDVLDPLLAGESDREEEMVAILKIALACVQTNPEKRPPMRHVLDAMNILCP